MKKIRIVVELTEEEASLLSACIGNGWGDGDFAGWLGGGQRGKSCERAIAAWHEAHQKARRGP